MRDETHLSILQTRECILSRFLLLSSLPMNSRCPFSIERRFLRELRPPMCSTRLFRFRTHYPTIMSSKVPILRFSNLLQDLLNNDLTSST